jgi:hypothetical protein
MINMVRRKFMRSVNVKLWGCIGSLMVLAMIIFGCGSGNDLLNEVGQRYSANVEIVDNAEPRLTIDIAQDLCDSTWEDYGPSSANVTISVASDAPGITLQSYTIDYIPQLSATGDPTVPTVMPEDLATPLPAAYNIDIPSGGSATFSIIAISTDTKEEYRRRQGWAWDSTTLNWVPPVLNEGVYTIQFAFTFLNTEGQTEIVTKNVTVWFGDFDNC